MKMQGIKNFFKRKEGQTGFGGMGAVATALVTLAILFTVGFLIMSQAKTQIGQIEGIDVATNCNASKACNATADLQSAMDTAVNFVPIIVITSIGAILLGLVALFTRR